SGAGVYARGRAGAVLGDDGPVALLHERERPATQDPRDRRGGRRGAGELRAETSSERGAADDREHGQGPGERPTGDARDPGGRPGDDLPHDDGDRDRRGAAQSLRGADGGRGAGADAGDPPPPAREPDAGGPALASGARESRASAPQRAAAAASAA